MRQTPVLKNAIPSKKSRHARVMWLAVALALTAAIAYVMIAMGILGVGDLNVGQDAGVIVYVAAGCYLLGGLLILVRRRWLWIIGILINALVMLFFFNMYQSRPAVMFSPGGIATKAPQLLLEVTLIYLIVVDWLRPWRRLDKKARA
jgi:hypothetical protein